MPVTLRTGGLQNWDMSLFKNIPFGRSEVRYIELRSKHSMSSTIENCNNKNYSANVTGSWAYASPTDPLTITKDDSWGTFSDTYGGVGDFRVVQLGAKVYF